MIKTRWPDQSTAFLVEHETFEASLNVKPGKAVIGFVRQTSDNQSTSFRLTADEFAEIAHEMGYVKRGEGAL